MKGGGLGYAEAAFSTQQLQQLFGIIRCPLEYHQYTQPWFIKYNQVSLRSGVPTIKLPFEYHLYTQLWYYQVSLRVDQVSPRLPSVHSTFSHKVQSSFVICCVFMCPLEYHRYTQLWVTEYGRHSLYVVSLCVPRVPLVHSTLVHKVRSSGVPRVPSGICYFQYSRIFTIISWTNTVDGCVSTERENTF